MKMYVKDKASEIQVNVIEGSGSQVITQFVGGNYDKVSVGRHLDEIKKAIRELDTDERVELLAAFDELSDQADQPVTLLENAKTFHKHLSQAAHDYTAIRTPLKDMITWLAANLPSS